MNVYLLIAEDDALRQSLRAVLPEGDLLLQEATADDALRRLISIRPDVAIVDDVRGLGANALRQIRQAIPAVPVVVLTSRDDGELIAQFKVAGAAACLAKPFSCDALRDTMERLARREEPAPSAPAHNVTAPEPDDALPQHQRALRWINRIAGYIGDRDRLSQSLTDALTDVFDAVRCAVLVEAPGGVRVAASHGLRAHLTESIRLQYLSGLMRWFEEHACLIDRDAARSGEEAVKEMHVLGARLGAPLFAGGRVVGALLIGEKVSGRAYTASERELLTVVARSASTNLENAQLYRDVSAKQTRLDALLAHVTSGVVWVQPDRNVALLNQSAERMLQVRASEVVGRSIQKLGSGFADVVLRTMADQQPRLRQEIRDPAIDATLGLSATPMGEEGVVVVFSRVPKERADTEDIAYSPFWEYLAERVGQEIKNPMVAINTFAQLLPRKYDSEDFRSAFEDVVTKEIGRVNNVAETLFEFARHPRMVLHRSNLNETVENVLRTFQEELSAHSIRLETELDPQGLVASIDPIYFAQALHNIVQNSIEAMDEGGTLRIRTRQQDGECEVEVADSGPGVSEQDADLIFMPFFSTKEKGMGLGLTLANRIMRQHEGELRLVSTDAGGAFAMRVPVCEAPAPD